MFEVACPFSKRDLLRNFNYFMSISAVASQTEIMTKHVIYHTYGDELAFKGKRRQE